MTHPRYLPEGERLVYLAEYNVRQGTLLPSGSRTPQLELVEEDPVPGDETAPAGAPAPEAAAPAEPVAPEAPAEAAPSKVEILSQVAHAQHSEISQVTAKVDQILAQVMELEQTSVNRQRALEDRLNAVNDQVRRLTPPSPLEQMQNMIKVSGGQSIEDYFNEWAQKNGDPSRLGPQGMYQQAENPEGEGQKFFVDVDKVPSLSPEQAKRSLGL